MSKLKVEVEVPDWVNWMAVDPDGEVWGFEFKPIKENPYSCFEKIWRPDKGKAKCLYLGPKPKKWREELYTWA